VVEGLVGMEDVVDVVLHVDMEAEVGVGVGVGRAVVARWRSEAVEGDAC
jgi:GTP cyclohydrolase III